MAKNPKPMTSAAMNELRTLKVSPERRKEIAQLAAAARWLEKRREDEQARAGVLEHLGRRLYPKAAAAPARPKKKKAEANAKP